MAIGDLQTFQSSSPTRVADAQRVFLNRVYGWMTMGLGLTGLIAWYTAQNVELAQGVAGHLWLLLIAELGLVVLLSWMAPRLGGALAGALFLVYAGLNGLTLSMIFFVYQLGSIANAFGLTAVVFGSMSLYGAVTKRDLAGWRSFLVMGLWGVVLAAVVNLFLRNSMLDFVVSCATVVVFTGLTAYDTQKLRRFQSEGAAGDGAALAIVGALMLYLDFINLFLAFLRLFGRRR